MQTSISYTINGIKIVVVSLTLENYEDDFSLIVKRYMVMENLDNLFAMLSMAGRIYLISRSRIPEVNVGDIARDMGGGGHATAASATVHNMSLIEAQEKLIRILHRHIQPQSIAREMMSQPVISIPESISIDQANQILTRYNVTAIPVIEETKGKNKQEKSTKIKGIISRMIVEKAIFHQLGHFPVSEYMTGDIEVLPMSATLSDIEDLIIDKRQRLVPIIDEARLAGVITRTDLLNMLVNDPAHLPQNLYHETNKSVRERVRNLNSLIVELLDKEFILLLRTIGEVAEQLGFKAVAVGGFVRDLLLKKKNLDLDVVVEGNGIVFAEKLVDTLGGHLRPHERFLTANITLENGFKIDVATARLEYYEYPAALPTVELSSIKLDLYRRDFTINAMALQLNPEVFGTLLDFFGSQADLREGSIKVLHNLSFVEDPTRIFRAIRFEKRMHFTIAPHTSRLINSAVKMKLFGKDIEPRFFTELKLIFSEENPIPSIERLAELHLFQFLWPDLKPHLKVDRRFNHILNQAHRAVAWYRLLYLEYPLKTWKVYLLAIMGRSKNQTLKKFCLRFNLSEKLSNELVTEKSFSDKIANQLYRKRDLTNSYIYWQLHELREEGLLYLMAIARKTEIKVAVSRYVTTLRKIKTDLDGVDLKEIGYRPGPSYKKMLNKLLSARLDGLVNNREDELAFLRHRYPCKR